MFLLQGTHIIYFSFMLNILMCFLMNEYNQYAKYYVLNRCQIVILCLSIFWWYKTSVLNEILFSNFISLKIFLSEIHIILVLFWTWWNVILFLLLCPYCSNSQNIQKFNLNWMFLHRINTICHLWRVITLCKFILRPVIHNL